MSGNTIELETLSGDFLFLLLTLTESLYDQMKRTLFRLSLLGSCGLKVREESVLPRCPRPAAKNVERRDYVRFCVIPFLNIQGFDALQHGI